MPPLYTFTTVVLVSVITAFVTALLATAIFVLMQIAVCKCHPKVTLGGADERIKEEQIYEQVDGPTPPQIKGGANTFELNPNEAYSTVVIH